MSIKTYIKAARLKTLPLAVAGTLSGNLLAFAYTELISIPIFILSVLTAISLQILSNFANDYGDHLNGADNAERTDRVMASGEMSLNSMKNSIRVLIAISLICGLSLLFTGLKTINKDFYILLGMGLIGIAAAYFYTAGKRPYGYIGLGDISVFIFFGLLSVLGTYYLQTGELNLKIILSAMSVGMLSTGVLNVNNIRDIETDSSRNKTTIPVLLGRKYAEYYHLGLLITALNLLVLVLLHSTHKSYTTLIHIFIFVLILGIHFYKLLKCDSRNDYNQQLKQLSLSTLFLMLYFCSAEIFLNGS